MLAGFLRFAVRETGEAGRVAETEALGEFGIEIERAAVP
jgi:hypothetical protein